MTGPKIPILLFVCSVYSVATNPFRIRGNL